MKEHKHDAGSFTSRGEKKNELEERSFLSVLC